MIFRFIIIIIKFQISFIPILNILNSNLVVKQVDGCHKVILQL